MTGGLAEVSGPGYTNYHLWTDGKHERGHEVKERESEGGV